MLRSGGAEILLDAIAVVAGRATELGDVRIASNPRVRITALFPSGRVPPMYKIAAECAGKRGSRLVDSSGHCEFADIPGGSWKIEAPGEPFFLVGGLAHEFEIVPSVEREITIDLRGRTGAWLTITATLNGAPANGESLLARFGDAVDDARHTDARGRAMLWVPANVPIHASLHSNWGLPLGELVDGTTLLPGQEADTAVDLAVGELEIDLGELSGVDSETPATLSVETNAGAQIGRPIEIGGRYADRRDKSRVYALGPVAVGSYRLDLVATSTAIDGAEPANLHFARTVAIRAGELESVRFTDADLVK
jgi:hypothetical protein